MGRTTIAVSGMACTGCEQTVESAITSVDGVRSAEADHAEGSVEVVIGGDVEHAALQAAIRSAGYDPE